MQDKKWSLSVPVPVIISNDWRPTADPLTIAFVVSLTIFIPLISLGNYDLMKDSVFQDESNSEENTIVLACIVSMVFPLFVDIFLDLFAFRHASYLGFRFLSIFGIVASAVICLIYQNTEHSGAVVQVAYSWGYYIELTVITSLMYYLVPSCFTFYRVIALNSILYGWVITFNLNSCSAYNSDALFIVFYFFFYLFVLMCFGIVCQWLYLLRLEYLASEKSFNDWFDGLGSNIHSAMILLSAVLIAAVVFIVIFSYADPGFANSNSINTNIRILVEVTRSFLSVFTYILPSRLFRQQLLMAKADLDTKTEFVKYISHEIRSPAAVVLVGLELLEGQLDADEIDRITFDTTVSDMRLSMTFLLDILDDLLLYEKLERNTMKMNFENVRPLDLFLYVLQDYMGSFAVAPIDGDDANKLCHLRVRADLQKLKAAFHSIFKLLAKSRATGAVTVSYKAEEAVVTKPQLITISSGKIAPQQTEDEVISVFTIVIVDKKSGMTLVDIDNLINHQEKRFERAGHDDGEGSGFGLWIAKKFFSFHDATVAVEATPEGLVYEIAFPVIFVQTEPDEVSIAPRSLRNRSILREGGTDDFLVYPHGRPNRTYRELTPELPREAIDKTSTSVPLPRVVPLMTMEKRLRILVVDDSATIRKIVSNVVRSLGHSYECARDGDEALAKLRQSIDANEAFDVVLLDNNMPKMMGKDAVKVIRVELGYKGIILGLIGNGKQEVIDEYTRNGADRVLMKPLSREGFLNILNAFFCKPDKVEKVELSLDAAVLEKADVVEPVKAVVRRSSSITVGTRLHVLIVDDSSMIRKMMSQLMGMLGHTWVEANDGDKAIEIVREALAENRVIDVILLDNQMPKMMGKDAVKVIRAELGYKGVILGVTGNAMEEDIREFVRCGADEVILKPLTKDAFTKTYTRIASLKKAAGSGRSSFDLGKGTFDVIPPSSEEREPETTAL